MAACHREAEDPADAADQAAVAAGVVRRPDPAARVAGAADAAVRGTAGVRKPDHAAVAVGGVRLWDLKIRIAYL